MKIYQLVILFLLFAVPGLAQDRVAQAQALAEKGAIAFDQGEYQQAAKFYIRAHGLYPDARLAFGVVKAFEAGGELKKALLWVNRALSESPGPGLKMRLQNKKQALVQRLSTGELTLTTEPADAKLFIDGGFVGKAPLNGYRVKPGAHKIEVRAKRYDTLTRRIVVKGGATLKLHMKLIPGFGWLSLTTIPAGAVVVLDGEPLGNTPIKHRAVDTGKHSVEIRRAGFERVIKDINIEPAREYSVSLGLQALKKGEWYRSWPGWVVLGAGIAAGIGSGVELYLARKNHRDVNNAIANPFSTNATQQALDDKWNLANKQETVGYVLMGVAGAAVVTSTMFFIFKVGVPKRENRVDFTAIPGGGALWVRF